MDIPERLERIRLREKLSRNKFGAKLGKSGDAIYNLERGRSTIEDDFLESVCKVYSVNKKWLTDGIGNMYNVSPENLEISNSLDKIIDSEELSSLVSKIVRLSPYKVKVLNDLVDIMHENEK
ncbi:helix-turn-helix domain-containing protein [Paraclostridium sordellii]|uniref:helix-turn-helix domain-containing protein n=1 Tax=Paraclostridium sordellii TaxID=1505 RepID=UPI0022E326A4|nr:helix-turn-helix transcriptional regulator [Paeniclostridium sordellii]